jgi:hypothetical protein
MIRYSPHLQADHSLSVWTGQVVFECNEMQEISAIVARRQPPDFLSICRSKRRHAIKTPANPIPTDRYGGMNMLEAQLLSATVRVVGDAARDPQCWAEP